jgi:hypothetical protein
MVTVRILLATNQGTEPPETEHKKPSVKVDLDPNDPNREHEAGEVKVGDRWEFPVAQTKLGNLWGTMEESRMGNRILAFRGIAFAQAPVGPLRYRPPVPVPRWDGIKEAKVNGHVCPQHMYYKPDIWMGKIKTLTIRRVRRVLL